MSQIDQAFIKAYRTQLRAAPNSAAPASTLQRGSLAGQTLRVDAPHVQAESTPASTGSQRVPTPHLQLTPEVSARLSGLAGRSASGPAASSPNTTQRWSSKFRTRSSFRSTPDVTQPQAAERSITTPPAPAEQNYTSVEETLMRLIGVAEAEQEAEEIQIVSGRLQREVEVARTNEIVEKEAIEPTPVEPSPAALTPTVQSELSVERTVETVAPLEAENVVVAEEQPLEVEAESASAEPLEENSEPADTSEPEPESTSAEPLQPAWEVDSFHWPNVVSQLQTDPIAGVEAACNSLRNTVGAAGKILAVSGVDSGVGATTVSLLLARGLAKLGLKVALVDADFENPSLAESLGVRIQDGWEAAIDGRLPLEEVCVASLSDGVTLVPLVQNAEASATKASLNAAGVLKQLRDVFDFVLIDAGTGSENVAAVATSSDEVLDVAVLLAVDERHFDGALTSEIITHLKQFSIESIQMVQTFVAA